MIHHSICASFKPGVTQAQKEDILERHPERHVDQPQLRCTDHRRWV